MNEFDENGEPHGYWESFWTDGSIYSDGYFIHGNRNGYWNFYWNNKIDCRGNFLNNKWIGYWEGFDHNEILIYKRYVIR